MITKYSKLLLKLTEYIFFKKWLFKFDSIFKIFKKQKKRKKTLKIQKNEEMTQNFPNTRSKCGFVVGEP